MSGQCVKSWHRQYTLRTGEYTIYGVGNIDMKNPETVQINGHYGYISIVYFDENLAEIEAVVIYGLCTRNLPEGIWDFPIVIQTDILYEFYTVPMQCNVPVYAC